MSVVKSFLPSRSAATRRRLVVGTMLVWPLIAFGAAAQTAVTDTAPSAAGAVLPAAPQPLPKAAAAPLPKPAPAAPQPTAPAKPLAEAPPLAAPAPAAPPVTAPPAIDTAAPNPALQPQNAQPVPVALSPPAKKKRAAPPPPRETALSDDPAPTLQADTFFATAKASERYGAIVDAGGWPTDIVALKPGAKGPAVAELRKRLAIEGELAAFQGEGMVWDDELTAAVKRFQGRVGLRQSGVVAGATLKAINVPAKTRFNQLASSANRIAGSSFAFGERYVVVNLPSTSVEAIENGRVVHRYLAIVGDPEHPSPEISARVQAVNLNPTWTVPTSIIKKEIIPRMQRDPGYLTRAKIRILDGTGAEVDAKTINWATSKAVNYTLRQDSGAGNSLGSIRINMPNKLAVYMHDTPSKRLFGANYRFLSHGCVRVQGVYNYAQWLLEGTPGSPTGAWDKAALEAKAKDGAHEDIRLARPVPVTWVYLTGWSNSDGPANFRDDVYGLDSVGEVASSTPPPAAPTAAAPAPPALSGPAAGAR